MKTLCIAVLATAAAFCSPSSYALNIYAYSCSVSDGPSLTGLVSGEYVAEAASQCSDLGGKLALRLVAN